MAAAIAAGADELEAQTAPLLRRNNTSQIAIVGSNSSPIESLDYEIVENDLFSQDWRSMEKGHRMRYVFLKWAFCLAIGVLTGAVGFFNNLAVENVVGFKLQAVSDLMDSRRYWAAFFLFASTNLALLLLASAITAFVSPAAGGSGIPEVRAYLNGVDAPDIFTLKTLFVKVVGTIAAVSSSLNVGKAEPMVHAGACIASAFGHGGSRRYGLTCRWLRYFKNDRDRRDLATVGASAGVTAAFRSPVGGVLFALEALSSWWRSALIWRSFFTAAVVLVLLRQFIDLCRAGGCGLFGQGGLIMYDVTDGTLTYHLADIPTVIFLGVAGGLLGSLYNHLLSKILPFYNSINDRGHFHKLALAGAMSVLTSSVLFALPWLARCRPCPDGGDCLSNRFRAFQCAAGQYNDLASLFLNTHDDAIRNLYSAGTADVYHPLSMALFFLASYSLGLLSYGVAAPFGLIVPAILTGATSGRLAAMLLGSRSSLDHGLLAILGSAAFLGGTLRMTVSICVIILELTNNLLLLPLVMLVLLISKAVADSFTGNVYDVLLRLKGLPFLADHAEPYMRQLAVSEVVCAPLRTVRGVEKVGEVVHLLRTTGHNAFPVITGGELYGLILRAHILVLLKKKAFLAPAPARSLAAEDFDKRSSGKHESIGDISISGEEMEMFIDLRPFSNTSPYTVVETMSVAKALVLFRQVGLRHLLIVPKCTKRAPAVGILTRHDFMPEHVLGLRPELLPVKSKRMRWGSSAVKKQFRSLLQWLAHNI